MDPDIRQAHMHSRERAESSERQIFGEPVRFVLVLEQDGFQVLIDPRDLWKPPRVLVRRGPAEAEVWLDEDDVSFMRSRFSPQDERLVLELVHENLDDLLMWWCSLKDDVRRGRLERNVIVY